LFDDRNIRVVMACVFAANAAVMSMNIRPHAPTVAPHTSTSLPESVGRPLRPWVKITSSTVNGLRYTKLSASSLLPNVTITYVFDGYFVH